MGCKTIKSFVGSRGKIVKNELRLASKLSLKLARELVKSERESTQLLRRVTLSYSEYL